MSIPFEFPPGHKIRIANFITDLKRRSRRRCTSNSLPPTTDASLPMKPPSKKRKLLEDKSTKQEDVPTVTAEVRKKVLKWTHNYDNGTFDTVEEGRDYIIRVTRSSIHPTTCDASITCGKCGNSYIVTKKQSGDRIISNWSKHFKICGNKKKRVQSENQSSLKGFLLPSAVLPSSTSSAALSNHLVPSAASSMASNHTVLSVAPFSYNHSVSSVAPFSSDRSVLSAVSSSSQLFSSVNSFPPTPSTISSSVTAGSVVSADSSIVNLTTTYTSNCYQEPVPPVVYDNNDTPSLSQQLTFKPLQEIPIITNSETSVENLSESVEPQVEYSSESSESHLLYHLSSDSSPLSLETQSQPTLSSLPELPDKALPHTGNSLGTATETSEQVFH